MEDIKWKPSKKECSSSKSPFMMRSFSTKGSSSSSSSNKSSSLLRSSSTKCSPSSSIGRKCSNMAKEQKTKLYIMKRCVAMLMPWHKHRDS